MSKQRSQSGTTQDSEPQPARVSELKPFPSAVIEMSWRIALPFMLFSLGGIQLDKWLETEPIFSLLGVVIGLLSVAVVVYRYVQLHYPGTFGGKK